MTYKQVRTLARASVNRVKAEWLRHSLRHGWKESWKRAKPHGLASRLVVSLTSYPPRFGMVAHTLRSLLAQTVRPDLIVLWVTKADQSRLPTEIAALQDFGLLISCCDDMRSYKKLIPALAAYPDAVVATADDDLYYAPDWLEQLVARYRPASGQAPCHRAHEVLWDSAGAPLPYERWNLDIAGPKAGLAVFGTTGGGALFHQSMLHRDFSDYGKVRALCPTADDIWFYWMLNLNGHVYQKFGPKWPLLEWQPGGSPALHSLNLAGGENSRQMAAMLKAYGPLDQRLGTCVDG